MSRHEAVARILAAAARDGADVGDLLGAACSLAAARVGGSELLVNGRPGSWEAEHVRSLAGGWEYVSDAERGPVQPIVKASECWHLLEDSNVPGYAVRCVVLGCGRYWKRGPRS